MEGSQKAVELDLLEPLGPQLKDAPRDIETLNLEKEIPSDADWDLLSNHFTSVKHLFLDSGWNEDLNDEKIPLQWPLEKLTISTSCGEVCRSPWVLEGRVPHLVFNYTAGLRFEGPTTEELIKANQEAIAAGEKDAPDSSRGVTLTWVPDLVTDWMHNKYANKNKHPDDDDEDGEGAAPTSNLQTLEIIHNDARDTLFRYVLARPHLIDTASTLSLVACSRYDLDTAPPRILEDLFPQLTNLRTLVLVLGDHYRDREQLPAFYRSFPPNLKVLRFRSSVSLAGREEVVEDWVKAFGDKAFLPGLERLSFVLDLEDGEGQRREVEEWEAAHPEGHQSPEKKGEEDDDDESSEGEGDEGPDEEQKADEEKKLAEEPGDVVGEGQEIAEGAVTASVVRIAPPKVSDETLAWAKRACARVCCAAESRGVLVQPFMGDWNEGFTSLKSLGVDERWNNL